MGNTKGITRGKLHTQARLSAACAKGDCARCIVNNCLCAKCHLKAPFGRSADGECMNCGRQQPECRCGEVVSNRACIMHREAAMRVLAIPVYRYRAATGTREISEWVNVAECTVRGCNCVRNIKRG